MTLFYFLLADKLKRALAYARTHTTTHMGFTHLSTLRLLSCDCEMFENNKITILGSVPTLATHQKHARSNSMKLQMFVEIAMKDITQETEIFNWAFF